MSVPPRRWDHECIPVLVGIVVVVGDGFAYSYEVAELIDSPDSRIEVVLVEVYCVVRGGDRTSRCMVSM